MLTHSFNTFKSNKLGSALPILALTDQQIASSTYNGAATSVNRFENSFNRSFPSISLTDIEKSY